MPPPDFHDHTFRDIRGQYTRHPLDPVTTPSSHRIGKHGVKAVNRGEVLGERVGRPAVVRLRAGEHRGGESSRHATAHVNSPDTKQDSSPTG